MKKIFLTIFILIVVAAGAVGTFIAAKNMVDKDKKKDPVVVAYSSESEFESAVLDKCSELDTTTLSNAAAFENAEEPAQAAKVFDKLSAELKGFESAFKLMDAPSSYAKDWKKVRTDITDLKDLAAQIAVEMRELALIQKQANLAATDSEIQDLQNQVAESSELATSMAEEFGATNKKLETLGTKLNIGACFGV